MTLMKNKIKAKPITIEKNIRNSRYSQTTLFRRYFDFIIQHKLIILILLIGIFLRVYGIGSESYWLDESISLREAGQPYWVAMHFIEKDSAAPLYVSLLHFWVGIFGMAETSARSLSAIFGVLSILAIYLLAKKLFNKKAGYLAALLIAFSPSAVYFSQEARQYSLFLLLTICSFYFFTGLLDTRLNDKRRNIVIYSGYVVFTTLMLYTHIFGFIIILLEILYYVYYNYKKENRLRILAKLFLILLILFALILPWLPIMIKQSSFTILFNWIPVPDLNSIGNTMLLFFDNWFIFCIFIILIFTSIIFRKKLAVPRRDIDKLLMLVYFGIIPIILVFCYSIFFNPLFIPKYFLFLMPFYYIIFSYLLTKFADYSKYAQLLLIFVLLMFTASLVLQYVIADKQDWRSVSEFLKQNVSPNTPIFVHPYYATEPLTFYYDKTCFDEYDLNTCILKKDLILSLSYQYNQSLCCNDSSILTTTDNKNKLGYYTNTTFWLIMLNNPSTDQGLLNYFEKTKKIILKKEFTGDILLYKFE